MKKKDSIIKGIVNSVLPVILAFAFGAIIIAAIGESPLETYGVLIRKSLLTEKGFMNTLHYASPLILTGLAIAITFKANLYNCTGEVLDFPRTNGYSCDINHKDNKVYFPIHL